MRQLGGNKEAGGTYIGAGYTRLIGAAEKHGVELVDVTPMLEFFREQELVLGTEIIRQSEWPTHRANPFPDQDRALMPWTYHRVLTARENPLANPAEWLDPRHAIHDISLRDWMYGLGLDDDVLAMGYGINVSFGEGALMVIDDHINLTGGNPLIGPNDDRFGTRFPDMTTVYSRRLGTIADQAAEAVGVAVAHGVYVGVPGPSYETPAEIRLLRTIGADAVGMSTVPEAIAARHEGLEVLGISCITNMAAGVLPGPLDHDDVLEVAHRAGRALSTLLEELIGRF